MFAVIAGVLYLIAFVLHWAGKGNSPFDMQGFFLLGMIALAVHVAITDTFWPRRPGT